jgi:hypothetical protein
MDFGLRATSSGRQTTPLNGTGEADDPFGRYHWRRYAYLTDMGDAAAVRQGGG